MKIKDVELFTDDIMDIINKEEYIGIRISGGIDSSILCHIVLKYFPHVKLLPITFYNKLRPIAESSVNNVLRVLNELNPNNNLMPQVVGIFDTTGFVKIDDYTGIKRHPKDIFQRQFVRDLFDKHAGRLNFILSGETMNPPIDVQIALGMEHEFNVDRNGKRANLLNIYRYNNGSLKYEYSPFRNSDKKEIAEICKELNLMDSLFPVSETCETEPHKYTGNFLKNHFGMTYDRPGIEPCQGCWPCREKYWAYGVFDFNTPKRVKDLDI